MIRVCGYWGFHIYLVGFVLCIGALFSMHRGWRGGAAPPPGAVADVNDTAQSLMITILPVYMYVSGAAGDNLGAAYLLCVVYVVRSKTDQY